MTVFLTIVLVLSALYLTITLPTLRRLFRSCREEITPEWPVEFSVEKYRPMQHLLNRDDFDFLSRQPGYDAKLLRKLREDRLQIYRMYLFSMIRDANALYHLGRCFLAQAQEDHSALLVKLALLRLRFCAAVLRADLSFHLCRLGIGTLPARTLLEHLDALQAQTASAYR